MSLEEGLVDRDVLDADNTLLWLQLDHPIDEEKRIAVRKHLHDFFDSEHLSLLR